MIIAELAVFPTSEGSSVSRYVKEVIRIIEASGQRSVTGGMSTTIETPDLNALFEVIGRADETLVRMGARRIHIDLRIDHRLDKEATIASKMKAIER
ncbi:MAG: MTH1187 family thiamine-binding protein [Candidatus Aminicenantes bacterium]|jgi:uncharacterized protein (TIGR00106 family)|nr:MTH1187 family thiamine-binding protein [Candidatus Aminicenantes bacterium]